MERFIADLIKNYESGGIDRREVCKTIALAATVYAAGDAAKAQAPRGFKMIGVNHISYTCPDYTKARDFFTKHLGMVNAQGKDTGSRANLMFGPEQGKGGGFMVVRNATGAVPQPGPGFVDHFCFTIPNWDDARVQAGLKETGRPHNARAGNASVLDPFNYPVQLANNVEENAWK